MGLAHGALLQVSPVRITVVELRVAITAIGVLLCIFFPQQLLGDALAFEFLVEGWPVRNLMPF